MKTLTEQISDLIEPSLKSMGFELVQVKFIDGNKSRTLQIMAERPDGSMTLDDCTLVSRQVSAILDVEDSIADEYRLEISSPGIDRPLVKRTDYVAYLGHAAKIETAMPVEGRKRFSGALKAVEGESIVITVDNKDYALPLVDIAAAKLVLTDRLIKEHQKKAG